MRKSSDLVKVQKAMRGFKEGQNPSRGRPFGATSFSTPTLKAHMNSKTASQKRAWVMERLYDEIESHTPELARMMVDCAFKSDIKGVMSIKTIFDYMVPRCKEIEIEETRAVELMNSIQMNERLRILEDRAIEIQEIKKLEHRDNRRENQ